MLLSATNCFATTSFTAESALLGKPTSFSLFSPFLVSSRLVPQATCAGGSTAGREADAGSASASRFGTAWPRLDIRASYWVSERWRDRGSWHLRVAAPADIAPRKNPTRVVPGRLITAAVVLTQRSIERFLRAVGSR
jgi:hypothetical protein